MRFQAILLGLTLMAVYTLLSYNEGYGGLSISGAEQMEGWQVPVMGVDRPVVWVIETSENITAGAIALGLDPNTVAYSQWGEYFGMHRCEIYTPPPNDIFVLALIRHELAHCVRGHFHD